MPRLVTLTELIAQVPEDYDWLLRSGRPGEWPNDLDRFFCHIPHKDVTFAQDRVVGPSFKAYGPTPEIAMAACLRELGASVTAQ